MFPTKAELESLVITRFIVWCILFAVVIVGMYMSKPPGFILLPPVTTQGHAR